jgi:hypothetical protein
MLPNTPQVETPNPPPFFTNLCVFRPVVAGFRDLYSAGSASPEKPDPMGKTRNERFQLGTDLTLSKWEMNVKRKGR